MHLGKLPQAVFTMKLKQISLNRNTLFYLHLTRQKITSPHPSSPSFEGLILHYLDQLENLLPALVSDHILPSSNSFSDLNPSTVKLATIICGLERLTRAARELLPTRKSYPRQLLGMIHCLWATGGANLGALFTTEQIWATDYSEQIIRGFKTNSVPEKFARHALGKVLLYLAEAERICFTDLAQLSGIGNLCFCIRQLRQTISHHLLFKTFHPKSTSIREGSLVPEFVEREPGFTNIVLLHDAVINNQDKNILQPGAPKPRNIIFFEAVFMILGFISSHYTCLIFSLFSAPPDITHGLMQQTWSLRLAASAGVIGCFCVRARAATMMIGTIPCALGVLLVLTSAQSASSLLVTSVGTIFIDHLMFLSVVPFLLVSAREEGFWTAVESTAVLYGVIRLVVFAVDRNGIKRMHRDLARIGQKYKRWNKEPAGVHRLQLTSGLSV